MPGARARTVRRDAGSRSVRLAVIPALIGLLVAIAAPTANAAKPGAPHRKGHVRTAKMRVHRPKAPARGRKATPRVSVNAGCVNADVPASSGSEPAISAAVLCLVNRQRAAHGLPTLHENARLDRSAQSWTNTMVQTGTFSHGTNFTGRIDAVGYDWSLAGENVGTGYATPRQVVTAWMASPDHCRNILGPGYADVGTGVVVPGIAPYGPSTWTQDFGRLMSQNAPSANSGPMNACPYSG